MGILGVVFAAYYLVIALYAGPGANFAWIWILLAGLCFLQTFSRQGHRAVSLAAGSAFLFLALLLGLFSVFVLRGMRGELPDQLDYVIVLGAQVRGTQPSRSLRLRLDMAKTVAEKRPECILILSGGQGDNEDISEAMCMWEYLREKGIPRERCILEDQSGSTRENLLFSDTLTGCALKRCGILSNDFHIYRAVRLAESLGYRDPCGIPAPSDPIMQLHFVVREAAALAVSWLRGFL